MTMPLAWPVLSPGAIQALVIRDAIYQRVATLPSGTFKTLRKVGMPTLQAADLPACSIFYMGEDDISDGDPNLGWMKYINNAVIGVSVARGFADPIYLEGGLAQDLASIKNLLLTDPTFTKRLMRTRSDPGGLFEAVPRMRVEIVQSDTGEAYFAELRLAMTFTLRERFEPVIPDRLREVAVRTPSEGGRVQPVEAIIRVPQERRRRWR